MNANLNNSSIKAVTKISFDLNNPYQDEIIGQGKYKINITSEAGDIIGKGFLDNIKK